MARRHLTQEQHRELIREQIAETPEISDRRIAAGLGVDHKTVGVQRSQLASRGEIQRVNEAKELQGVFDVTVSNFQDNKG